jgi:hypothetical protein
MTVDKYLIPNSAVSHIISGYLKEAQTDGVNITLGISQSDVETVLSLFLEWAKEKNFLKSGTLKLEGLE